MNAEIPAQLGSRPEPRRTSAWARARDGGILLWVAGTTFFLGLGRLPLLEPDEGRNAEVAREMLAIGHWAVPHYDGLAYLDKPPLLFWLMAGSFKGLGLSELAARLPSALAAFLTMLLVAYLARQMFGRAVGLRSAVIFATAPLAIVFSRLVIFDMPLTLLVTGALICFWRGESEPVRPLANDLLFFAAMGLATLTKGPVGFLLPLLVILTYLALRRRLSVFRRLRWKWGLFVFLLIVLPWFILVCLRHPDFPRYAFWDESLRRFATAREHRTGSLLYYVPVYLGGFLPWSFFLVALGLSRIKKWRELLQERCAPHLFLVCWISVIFIFFSISQSKLPGYFLPALIPLSLLMGKAWSDAEVEARMRVPGWVTAGFGALVVLGSGGLLASRLLDVTGAWLVRKLPLTVLAFIKPEVFYSSLIVMALAVVGRDRLARGRGPMAGVVAFAALALTVPLLILRWLRPLELYVASNSSRALARTIQQSSERDEPVYGLYYFRTGLPFYLRRPVGLITTDADELTSHYAAAQWRRMPKKALGLFLPPSLAARALPWDPNEPLLVRGKGWRGPPPASAALVVARGTDVPAPADRADSVEPLWSGWQYSVWKVAAGSR